MSAVDDAIAEIDKELRDLAPVHEGLRDFGSLNLRDETKVIVQESITAYDRRKGLLEVARGHLDTLQKDGHPGIPTKDVTESVLTDLQANVDTIRAARERFASNAAVDMGLSAGAAESKVPPPPQPTP